MNTADYLRKAESHLGTLCGYRPHRRTGSTGNKAATDYVAAAMAGLGYKVDTAPFPCMDHESGPATLEVDGKRHEVFASPFSRGASAASELAVASSAKELEACDCRGRVLLLRGEIASEPLMPKGFVFYNPEHHRRIYTLLEEKQPAAIITASPRSEMAGAVYPFPMIEDGDFDIPSVYCTETTGDALFGLIGRRIHLSYDARRIPSSASNVIASRNSAAARKVVVCAHIDTKPETPGATDNASGVTVLLILAEMLAGYTGRRGIELAVFNGEDYYGAPGEMEYLKRYGTAMTGIELAVNVDGAGYADGRTAFSMYECPEDLKQKIGVICGAHAEIVEGEQWYQGDHMLFVQNGRPAIAITSEKAMELLTTVTHTPKDTPEIVDCRKIVDIADALRHLVLG